MRKLTELSVTGCLTLAAFVACSDASVAPTAPGSPVAPPSFTIPAIPLGTQIQTTINTILPASEASSLLHRWNNVVDELNEAQLVINKPAKYKSEIDSARARLVVAVSYLQSKTYKIIPPPGETKDHAAARLALMMSIYVYGGPGSDPPTFPPGSDAVLAIIQPSATVTTTIRTPLQHAAVQFPPGSVGETRILVIGQSLTPFPANCSGPLDTQLCQYPQFYDFRIFPDTRLLTPAIAAVCHINAGTARFPLANHDRFEIAHDAPVNPADRVAGGTIVDGIEILPFALVSGLTSCTGNSYQVSLAPAAPRGALGSALHWIAEPAARLASAIFGQLQPREAWAIDGLGGGRVSLFSSFATVDPASAPDLDVSTDPAAFAGSFAPGDVVPIGSWSVSNAGTATVRSVTAEFRVARDSMLTVDVANSAPAGAGATLVPGQSFSGSEASIALPAGLADGVYFVGVRAASGFEGGLADANIYNNRHTVRINVQSPTTPLTYAIANAATPVVPFGNAPTQCDSYTEQMTGINASITLPGAQEGGGGMTLTTIEQLVTECGATPLPISQQSYIAGNVTRDGDVVTATFVPNPNNLPQATLEFTGTLSADLSTLAGTFTWHRTDRASPLDWTVVMDATLVRQGQIP